MMPDVNSTCSSDYSATHIDIESCGTPGTNGCQLYQ